VLEPVLECHLLLSVQIDKQVVYVEFLNWFQVFLHIMVSSFHKLSFL
jgi:hypothetical protein